ncbi:MAG: helix-turn-helix transcriptional regulator [Tannerellaceae bacterium]|jgi:AraC-like DNA-binding protein|nr:helix-turn-helix transcriptional regulator [Tannerellaceae bacterium]
MDYRYSITEPLSLRLYSPVQSTGFRFSELKDDPIALLGLNKDYNHLLFVLEGSVTLSCNEYANIRVGDGEFALIPIAADVMCRPKTLPCSILTFSFEKFFHLSDRDYVNSLCDMLPSIEYAFVPATVRTPLDTFLRHLQIYFKLGMNKPLMHEIKHVELAAILRSFYPGPEIARLFYPILGRYLDFRIEVLRNYRKVAHVDDLADMFGIEKRTFGRQFKDEFGMSPYRWILSRKAKHIHFSLSETAQSLDDIRREHGFKFPGHFTRFCREQFNMTPTKLARSLRQSKIKH